VACMVSARDTRLRSKAAAASDVESDKLSALSSASGSSTSDDDVCTTLRLSVLSRA